MLLVLFNPSIGPYQVLPLRARVDLGAMAIEGYSAFPKAGTSPSDCLVSYPGHPLGGSYPFAEKQSVYSTAPAGYLSLPPTRHDLTQGQKPEGRLKWG